MTVLGDKSRESPKADLVTAVCKTQVVVAGIGSLVVIYEERSWLCLGYRQFVSKIASDT
jgi:hypothetical protein